MPSCAGLLHALCHFHQPHASVMIDQLLPLAKWLVSMAQPTTTMKRIHLEIVRICVCSAIKR